MMREESIVEEKRYCCHCWTLIPVEDLTCPNCGAKLQPEIPAEEFMMEETLVDKYFSFRGRLTRKAFFLRNLIYMAITGIINYLFMPGGLDIFLKGGPALFMKWLIMPASTGIDPMLLPSRGAMAIILVVSLFLIIGQWTLTIRRCHDIGHDGKISFLYFVPGLNVLFALYLLLRPGTRGTNRYGEETES